MNFNSYSGPSGIVITGFSFSRTLISGCILLCLSGFGMAAGMASSNTFIQALVDEDKHGREMSFYYMAFIGSMPFGSLILGGIANHIGAARTFLIGGLFCIAGALYYFIRLPHLKIFLRSRYHSLGLINEKEERE